MICNKNKELAINMTLLFIVVFTLLMDSVHSKERVYLEKKFQDIYCPIKKQREVVLSNRMRVDCLTKTHAVEYDRAKNYRQAFTQALEYAMYSDRKAGIVLIYEKPTDVKFLERLRKVVYSQCVSIDIWVVGPNVNDRMRLVHHD